MAIKDQVDTVSNVFGSSLSTIGQYKWVLIGVVILAIVIAIIYVIVQFRKKKTQWTHKFKVKRILQNGTITPEIIHLARRFPRQQGVDVFELEKPLLGSYLIPAPGEYVDINTFSIILDSNNRIWNDKGIKFNKDTQSKELSMIHAGIDVEMNSMKERWQEAHQSNKKITTAELIKAGLKALGIVAIVILGILAISEWGDSQTARADMETQKAVAMQNLAEAVKTMETTVNTQQLQIVPMLKALYDTDNIAGKIQNYCPGEEVDE